MYTKAQIAEMIRTSDKVVARSVVMLNERQTNDEQQQENTKYHNGRGFRPCHASKGTGMAKFYLQRGYLSPKQLAYWRTPMACGNMRLEIYWAQLNEIAIEKAKRKAEREASQQT